MLVDIISLFFVPYLRFGGLASRRRVYVVFNIIKLRVELRVLIGNNLLGVVALSLYRLSVYSLYEAS